MFASMSPLIWVHFIAALIALPLGLVQLLAPRGTPVHRATGYFYIPVMLVTLVSALASYQPGTRFLFFYILAIIGLFSLTAGCLNLALWLRHRNPARLRAHAIDMGYSWLGLFMAFVSQLLVNPRFGISTLTPGAEFWTLFAAINLALYAAGSWFIFRRLVPSLQQAAR